MTDQQTTDELRRELDAAIDARDTSIFEQGSSPEHKARPLHPDSIRAGLLEAGARRRLAQRLEADATIDLAAWVRAAHEAGWEIKQTAELAGVTRATVYAWLGSRGDG